MLIVVRLPLPTQRPDGIYGDQWGKLLWKVLSQASAKEDQIFLWKWLN
jgi:hypothetical protein